MYSSVATGDSWQSTSINQISTPTLIEKPAQIFGFDVVDYIGEGAGSKIYKVRDARTHNIFAMKHVIVNSDKQQRFADQLLNEFEVGKAIQHPLVRRVLDVKVHRTILRRVIDAALVMELVDGTPLDRVKLKSLSLLTNIFSQVAKALQQIHEHGYVHCDLKPNNILVCADNRIKLIDLGQSCPAMTVKQRIQGTPDFISPEQVKLEPVTPRTDVFNLGATLYSMLSGKALPTLFNLKRTENSFLLDEAIPAPNEVNPKVPENLSQFVMECVRSNAAKRPANMEEVSRRLDLIALSIARREETAVAQPN